jgi:hypothetical protein
MALYRKPNLSPAMQRALDDLDAARAAVRPIVKRLMSDHLLARRTSALFARGGDPYNYTGRQMGAPPLNMDVLEFDFPSPGSPDYVPAILRRQAD